MKKFSPNSIVLITIFSALSLFAQSAELTLAQELAEFPDSGAQPITSVVYKNAAGNGMQPVMESTNQVSNLRSAAKDLLKSTSIHINTLNVTIPRTGIFMGNDRVSFSIYAPMQAVNNTLSFAGYIAQARMDESLVTSIQVLSLVAKRQINTKLKYSVKIDNHSHFESAITYKFNPSTDSGKSDIAASVRYTINF